MPKKVEHARRIPSQSRETDRQTANKNIFYGLIENFIENYDNNDDNDDDDDDKIRHLGELNNNACLKKEQTSK